MSHDFYLRIIFILSSNEIFYIYIYKKRSSKIQMNLTDKVASLVSLIGSQLYPAIKTKINYYNFDTNYFNVTKIFTIFI